MSIEYALFLLFFRRNSIFHIRLLLSRLLYLTLVNFKFRYVIILFLLTDFFCAKKKTKKKLIAKLLRIYNVIYYVRGLFVSYRTNVRTSQKMLGSTPLDAQGNIEYRLQYSLFFTFLNYHRDRLFLYFLVNYRISIIFLLFWVSIPNPA